MPGVGHFGQAARTSRPPGWAPRCARSAARGRPVMGICLGLQLFFESSEEAPEARGLGLLPGRVRPVRDRPAGAPRRVGPGGADRRGARHPVLAGVFRGEPQFFYHVHSYHPAGLPTATCSPPATTAAVFPTLVGPRQRARRAVPPGEVAARRASSCSTPSRGGARDHRSGSRWWISTCCGVRARRLECLVLRRGGRRTLPRLVGDGARAHRAGRDAARGGPAGAGGGDRPRARAAVQPEPGRDLLSAPARRGGAGPGVRRLRRAGRDGRHRRGARSTSSGSVPTEAGGGSPGRASARALDDVVALLGRAAPARSRTCFGYASPPHHPLPRRGRRPGGEGRALRARCATPAIRWSRRRATTPRGPTSSSSSTSPPATRRVAPRSTW